MRRVQVRGFLTLFGFCALMTIVSQGCGPASYDREARLQCWRALDHLIMKGAGAVGSLVTIVKSRQPASKKRAQLSNLRDRVSQLDSDITTFGTNGETDIAPDDISSVSEVTVQLSLGLSTLESAIDDYETLLREGDRFGFHYSLVRSQIDQASTAVREALVVYGHEMGRNLGESDAARVLKEENAKLSSGKWSVSP